MTQPRRTNRSLLESPLLAAGLAVVVLGLAAVLVLPGLLGGAGPFVSPTPAGPAGPLPSPTDPGPSFVRPTPSPQPSFVTHVVQSGDTLNSIAREYRTTARSIAWWNRGAHPSLDPESSAYDPNRLEVGWVLRVLPDTIVDDNNPPPASPAPIGNPGFTPRPSSRPTPPPTGGPTPTDPAGPAVVVYHGPRTTRNIALTFDMGGRLDPAVDIVRWLIEHEVHATLFPTGRSGTQTAEGLAAMELAATRPDLFDFANHSWDHPDFPTLSRAQMADQLVRTETALRAVVGTTRPWFRPPFGGLDDAVRAGVGAAGWRSIVMWDIDTIDWRPLDNGDGPAGPTAEQIAAKIGTNARGGSIVLMHLGGWNTLEALPGIIAACERLDLEPVTLTGMLGA
jgi:peptidoglycan/xylan/chitin deacetylase (PgdA/CDA1 family)